MSNRIRPEKMVAHLTSMSSPKALELAHKLAALDFSGLSYLDPRETFNRTFAVLAGASLENAEHAILIASWLTGLEEARHLHGVLAWIRDRINGDIVEGIRDKRPIAS